MKSLLMPTSSPKKLKTAVLVVHGMGSQRPMETVRGVFNALWKSEDLTPDNREFWMIAEPSGNDIDLMTIATRFGTKSDKKEDQPEWVFHELYWAHLMTGTKSGSVLKWLFELASKGPDDLNKNIRPLWWMVVTFLILLIHSVVYILFYSLKHFLISNGVSNEVQVLNISMYSMFLVISMLTFSLLILEIRGLHKDGSIIVMIALVLFISISVYIADGSVASSLLNFGAAFGAPLANMLIVPVVSFMIVRACMSHPKILSWSVIFWLYCWVFFTLSFSAEFDIHLDAVSRLGAADVFLDEMAKSILWSLDNEYMITFSILIIISYIVLDILFLKDALGDAARYFRASPSNVAVRREIRKNAVNTLEMLNECGLYDRIIVIAHSLGSVIAYDMLRAYFGRINEKIPINGESVEKIVSEIEDIKCCDLNLNKIELSRQYGRNLIREIHEEVEGSRFFARNRQDVDVKPWLITDFITLGSPLTHAYYILHEDRLDESCGPLEQYGGESEAHCLAELKQAKCDFVNNCSFRRANEEFKESSLRRQFRKRAKRSEIVCSFHKISTQARELSKPIANTITYDFDHRTKKLRSSALFALTRWTNLYFGSSDLIRGDAVGGQVGCAEDGETMFGWGVKDVALTLDVKASWNPKTWSRLFQHTFYWDISDPNAEHLEQLRNAVDIADPKTD